MNNQTKLKITFWCIAIPVAGVLLWFIGAVIYIGTSMCEDTLVKTVSTPDRLYNVLIAERGCGATTGFTSVITLRKKGWLTQEKQIAVISAKPDTLVIHWQPNHVLDVEYPEDASLFHEIDEVYDVKIRYHH